MSRRPRQSRDGQDLAGRIEPRFAATPEPEARAPSAPPTPAPTPAPTAAPTAAAPQPNPYALPDHVVPAWVARPAAPETTAQARAQDAGKLDEPQEARPPARESYWSKIQVPDEERERAAKAGLHRYVKETGPHEAPRKASGAAPRPVSETGDGKPRIWLTVIALLALFGAGAYGLSRLADVPYAKQNAEWQPAESAQPPAPPSPAPAPAPAPNFIEVAP